MIDRDAPWKILGIEIAMLFTGLNHVLRFLLELGTLAGLIYWGSHTGQTATEHVLRSGSAALVALIWGLTLSPKAPARLPARLRLALSLPVFWLGSWAMFASGLTRTSITFAIIATINTAILFVFDAGELSAALQRHLPKAD